MGPLTLPPIGTNSILKKVRSSSPKTNSLALEFGPAILPRIGLVTLLTTDPR